MRAHAARGRSGAALIHHAGQRRCPQARSCRYGDISFFAIRCFALIHGGYAVARRFCFRPSDSNDSVDSRSARRPSRVHLTIADAAMMAAAADDADAAMFFFVFIAHIRAMPTTAPFAQDMHARRSAIPRAAADMRELFAKRVEASRCRERAQILRFLWRADIKQRRKMPGAAMMREAKAMFDISADFLYRYARYVASAVLTYACQQCRSSAALQQGAHARLFDNAAADSCRVARCRR